MKKLKILLILLVIAFACSTNPKQIDTSQLLLMLVLVFSAILSLISIVSRYFLEDRRTSLVSSLVVALYICIIIGLSSLGAASVKEIILFNLLFVVGIFYIKNNMVLSK